MNSRIHFGDARTPEAHGNEPVHLVITSPPYWTIKDYNTTGQIGHGDSYEDYIQALDEVWAHCYSRLLPGCKMCVNVGDQFLRAKTHGRYRVLPIRERIISGIMGLGADYMGAIIWQKMTNTNTTGGGTLMGSYPHPRNGVLKIDYEFILIFKKPGKAPKGSPEQKAESVMDIAEWSRNFSAHWDITGERQGRHHAMFPRELPRRLIRMYSFPGERVLDPFAGSGTTIDVAIEQGRVGEGIEINRDFEEVMRDRLGQRADTIHFTGAGETGRDEDEGEAFFGTATRLDQLKRGRWQNTGRVEVVEGPTQVRVNGESWTLEGLKSGGSACWQALSDLVRNKRVVVEPTTESFAYIRLLNRTLVNAKLIHLGVAEPDPSRQHRNRARFLRYRAEFIRDQAD